MSRVWLAGALCLDAGLRLNAAEEGIDSCCLIYLNVLLLEGVSCNLVFS